MSLFPGEITKQTRLAPPRTIRSTRYSLTARGRSTPSASSRLPTGSSSLLKASGWMRDPAPAAGTMPHMLLECESARVRECAGGGADRTDGFVLPGLGAQGRVEERLELGGAALGGVLGQRALARVAGDA